MAFESETNRRRAENERYMEQIAAVNGLHPHDVDPFELQALYSANVWDLGDPSEHPLYGKYISRSPNGRSRIEKEQQVGQLTESLFDLHPGHKSYGLYVPSYKRGLYLHKDASLQSSDSTHRSLLVGALTTNTIHEYAQTVRAVYPNAHCLVTDIEGDTTREVDPKTANFFYGSALHLPVPSGSIDSLHTNILLMNLREPKAKIDQSQRQRRRFLSEAYQALSPTGLLIMLEQADDDLLQDLFLTGFKTIQRISALSFRSRREMERNMFTRAKIVFESNTLALVVAGKMSGESLKGRLSYV